MSEKEHLQSLLEIKNMMNKSTRFISLSGISGVLAGVYALIAAFFARRVLLENNSYDFIDSLRHISKEQAILLFIIVFILIFVSLFTAVYLSFRKAKKTNEVLWNNTSKRLIINLTIPLITGAVYILISFYKNDLTDACALMLLFYGLSLINASKFTVGHIKYLGFIIITLGLFCHLFRMYSFWFWVFGFGIMHIVYGLFMHFILEKNGVNK